MSSGLIRFAVASFIVAAVAAFANGAFAEDAPATPPAGQTPAATTPAPPAPEAQKPAEPAAPSGEASTGEVVDMPARAFAYIEGKADRDEIYSAIVGSLGLVKQDMDKANLVLSGRPLAVFVESDDTGFEISRRISSCRGSRGEDEPI